MDSHTGRAIGALVCLLVVGAGCLGVITGSEPLVETASPVGVSESALASTDFEAGETRSAWLNESVEVAGQEREVRILNHVASYQIPVSVRPDGTARFGLFTVFSTPAVSVAGQGLNPLGRMPHRQLVDQVAGQSGDIDDVREEGTRELTVLGTTTTVSRYSATVRRSGAEVPVYIEVARVRDGEDFVVAVGVYPQAGSDVRPQVETLFGAIEH